MPSLIDLKKIREQHLYDNYGLTAQGFDPSAGMTDNPVENPFAGIPDIRPPAGDAPTSNFQDMMGDFDTSKQDAYNRLLAQRPEREDPGILRRIVAAGMSVGAHPGDVKDPLGVQEGVMYAPHARKMKDWSEQVEPAYRAAQLENTANANERQLRSSIMTNKTNMDRYEDINNQATRRSDITEQRNKDLKDIADKKNEIEAAWRAGYIFEKNGNQLWAIKKDGTRFMVSENADFSPLELERWRHRGDMEEIGKRTQGAIETKQAVPGANPTNNPGNANKDRNNKFQKVYDENPDLQKWFIQPTTTNGSWQMKEAPKMGRWLTGNATEDAEIESYNRARTALGLPTIKTRNSDTKPTAQPANTGRIKVVDPKTGRTGSIDNTKEAIEAASKAGLRVEVGK